MQARGYGSTKRTISRAKAVSALNQLTLAYKVLVYVTDVKGVRIWCFNEINVRYS